MSLWIADSIISPPDSIRSAGIWSLPGDLYFFSFIRSEQKLTTHGHNTESSSLLHSKYNWKLNRICCAQDLNRRSSESDTLCTVWCTGWNLLQAEVQRTEVAQLWIRTAQSNSVALVRQQTMPTERPPLVAEVSANSCRYRVSRGHRIRSLRPYSRLSRPEPLLFLPSSSSFVLTRLSGPRSSTTTFQKIWQRWESNPDLWICSQERWPLVHRGGLA
jgi:hypothetical protein